MKGLETLPSELEFDELELEEVTESDSDSDSEEQQQRRQQQRQPARDLTSSSTAISLNDVTDNEIDKLLQVRNLETQEDVFIFIMNSTPTGPPFL